MREKVMRNPQPTIVSWGFLNKNSLGWKILSLDIFNPLLSKEWNVLQFVLIAIKEEGNLT